MNIKKIYEIEKEYGNPNPLRCTSIRKIYRKSNGNLDLGEEGEYYSEGGNGRYLVTLEKYKDNTYKLINSEAEIIHEGIPMSVTRMKETNSFIIYLSHRYIIAIGSKVTYELKKTTELWVQDIECIPKVSWIHIKENNAYYQGKLLIIREWDTISIYHADDLKTQEVKIKDKFSNKVTAKFIEEYGVICIHEVNEKGVLLTEYFFSVNTGKEMKKTFSEV